MSLIKLIVTTLEVEKRALGRHIRFDERSRNFRIRKGVTRTVSKLYQSTNPVCLKQYNLKACTGFALAQMLNSYPFNRNYTENDARDFYHRATLEDEFNSSWPPNDTGSSTLGVLRGAKKLGAIKAYNHCFSIDDIIDGLQTSPGIIGTYWYEGFDTPDKDGLVKPTGIIRGGHEYTIMGCDLNECLIWFRTSYEDYGISKNGMDGMFCMTFDTVQALLLDEGDAAFVIV